ncbi:MAG: tetratricopeptide repeat protein, partial [Cyanobacteria bacterium]|nr:tetratricopeptide repeat protein [Cyanobacteriota bacterium]
MRSPSESFSNGQTQWNLRGDQGNALGTHYSRAMVLYEQRRFEDALKEFHKELSESPDCGDTTCMIACCFEAMGKIDQALEWSRKAISIDPENSLAFHVLGRALYRRKGFLTKDALRAFETSIKLNVSDVQNYYYLSHIRMAQKDWKAALSQVMTALNINPRRADCLAIAGWCEYQLGDPDKALELLKESLSIEPNVAVTHRYLTRIAVIKGDLELAKTHITEALRIDPQPAVDYQQQDSPYDYNSHDLMCEIVKAEGTLYGRWLTLMEKVGYFNSSLKARHGYLYPFFRVVCIIFCFIVILVCFLLFKEVVAVLVAGILLLCLLRPILWWYETGRMLLNPAKRTLVTVRQRGVFFGVPLTMLFFAGIFVIFYGVEEFESKSLLVTFKQAKLMEEKGNYLEASSKLKEGVIKCCHSWVLGPYRMQAAAHNAGLPVGEPIDEYDDDGEKSTKASESIHEEESKVLLMIVEQTYKELS